MADFERDVLVHLDSAYNLARWLLRDAHDASDVVQEACERAIKFFRSYRGGDSRTWFLKIVRNCAYTLLRQRRPTEALDELPAAELNPETIVLQRVDREALRRAIEVLPADFREVLVLRDVEGLSYKEIADVSDIPIGTVMSRLARARRRVQESLTREEVR